MKEQVKTFLINGSITVLTALAVVFAVVKTRDYRSHGEDGAKVWFYDQSAQRLYPAPRSLIPPDGNEDVRVRAMVIGFQGMENNVSQLKIAYLEKYNSELKALLERAVTAHAGKLPFMETIPSRDSTYFQDNYLVKRPDETSWHTAGTVEARQIMAKWREWRGPAGQRPIISVPAIR